MNSFPYRVMATAAWFVATMSSAHAVTQVPEPGTLVLSGIGLGIAVYWLHKNRKK